MKINWKYAIGEILIVIIGISLAYLLNSWKENRANENQKKQYIENLILDIKQEIAQLESNESQVQKKLKDIEYLMPFLGNPKDDRKTAAKTVFNLAQMINFYPENSTYQTLINSGDMKLIDNFQLRRSLEQHYAYHDIVLQNYGRIEQIHKKYLGDFFIHELDYVKIQIGDTSFLDNPLLRNIFMSIRGSYYMISQSNKQCIKNNKELLAKVENELAN